MSLARAREATAAVLAAVTPLGWTVGAFGALCWAVGVQLGWRELLAAAGTVLVVGAIATLFTIGRLDLESEISVAPPRVVVGERAAGELRLHNLRGHAVRGLQVELAVGAAVAAFPISVLRGNESTSELFVVPTNRRAVIDVGPVRTVKGDPLGLLRRTREWSDVHEIFVHPRTVPLNSIAAGLIRDMEGQATNRLSPSDIAFHTLRDYVPGDDRRHVHWKSSAKLDKLQVRQYVDTRRSHVAVLLSVDLDEFAAEDEFELAVSCAASVAVQALRDEQTLSLIVGGEMVRSARVGPTLDEFSRLEAARGSGGLDACLQAARRHAPDASVAVLCIGSKPGVPQIRQAASRIAADITTVVFQADLAASPRYQHVGSTVFFSVPELVTLGRSLQTVTL